MKTINRKQYKECEVVMLQTNNTATPLLNNHLYILSNDEIKDFDWVLRPDGKVLQMTPTDMVHYLDSQSKATKKIIASTDESLYIQKFEPIPQIGTYPTILPSLSQDFINQYIQAYNAGKPITKVWVEVENGNVNENGNIAENGLLECDKIIKVNIENTINILTEVKESWTREEVEFLIEKSLRECSSIDTFIQEACGIKDYAEPNFKQSVKKWIAENL